jgi:hypothetical protein
MKDDLQFKLVAGRTVLQCVCNVGCNNPKSSGKINQLFAPITEIKYRHKYRDSKNKD